MKLKINWMDAIVTCSCGEMFDIKGKCDFIECPNCFKFINIYAFGEEFQEALSELQESEE